MAQTRRPSFIIFSFTTLIILMMVSKSTSAPFLLGNICSNNTMFANNSLYEANLNTLFRFLSSNSTNPTGYHRAVSSSNNTTNDTVYGHFLCRGDQNASSCLDCVNTATTIDLPNIYCPNRKDAIIWYDECMVRYSNQSFFNRMDDIPSVIYWSVINISTLHNVTAEFRALLNNMLNTIAVQAASGGSLKKFAADFVNRTNSQNIYGMGQCTPDLSSSDCNLCLDEDGVGQFRESLGGRLLKPSCVVRFEVYPFFNLSSQPRLPDSPFSVLEDFTTAESLVFELDILQAATNYFSDDLKLGGGGFGNVYKGTLPNGQEIAVKRLSRISDQGIESFKNEAVLIAKLQHKNLVKLIGFCITREEKLLAYEFVPNKSLNYILFDPRKQGEIDWPTRYNIITGIARGLLYLHEDSRPRIIHRDLKAANILLEADMNPKIADFGLARIFKVEQTEDDTSIVAGTYGYMAPEYAMNGQFSIKSDVYSFGVLVLEIVSGKKISSRFHPSGVGDLLTYAWRSWKDETPLEFMDPTLRNSYSIDEVLRCIHLGLICVQENAQERPTMSTIVFMLNTNSTDIALPTPQRPRFYYNTSTESSQVTRQNPHSITTSSSGDSMPHSSNQVTISDMSPR